tara:strand:- start:543 stop:818 length:276 start_codon:yes stop_codon:yes gene_type:complete
MELSLTKLYIYCLFGDADVFEGVYSSLKSAHRDALKIANKGTGGVFLTYDGQQTAATLPVLKKIFNGELDIKVEYKSSKGRATIIKTKLRE